jgi:hypothetical protein
MVNQLLTTSTPSRRVWSLHSQKDGARNPISQKIRLTRQAFYSMSNHRLGFTILSATFRKCGVQQADAKKIATHSVSIMRSESSQGIVFESSVAPSRGCAILGMERSHPMRWTRPYADRLWWAKMVKEVITTIQP